MMVGVRVQNPCELTTGLKVRHRGERRFLKGKLTDNHSMLCIWSVLNSVCPMDLWVAGKAILSPVESADADFL